ncbi:MAG TPA: glucose-1-phosphate adenylyltransferase subunit GlgD [Mobilitalea sp.]|nr:glucose-1-phosphate adenylyltransferase subunit GlgD [Mobilitalea sp.]
MRDTMAIVYTGDSNVSLQELTLFRSVAALPFGGRYRIIDFILSNLVNSDIHQVGIITQNNYQSLMDHLDSGKQWDLDRKHSGLFILPPYVSHDNKGWYSGEVDAFHSNMSFLRRSNQKYVVISGSSMVCNLTYDSAMEFHKENNADITVIYKEEKKATREELSRHTLLRTDENNRIYDMEVKPSDPMSDKVSMEMYIMDTQLFQYLIDECVARGQHNFIKDILIKKMDKLKILGFPYDGYLAKIDSIDSYFHQNLGLINPANFFDLFHRSGLVYTKVKDEVPAKYGVNAKVENSLVADGCIINGQVDNCILFRGVKIAEGAVVKNSIVMQDTEIQEKVMLENAILDKEVIIRKGKHLIGQDSYPVVIRKRSII